MINLPKTNNTGVDILTDKTDSWKTVIEGILQRTEEQRCHRLKKIKQMKEKINKRKRKLGNSLKQEEHDS